MEDESQLRIIPYKEKQQTLAFKIFTSYYRLVSCWW